MSKITAAEVSNLRKKTGAGMMDCKKALVESNGNIGKAIDVLRKKGQKIAQTRTDRTASEGLVLSKANANHTVGALLCLSCETDFVAKNKDFISLTSKFLDIAVENSIKSREELLQQKIDDISIENKIIEQMGILGEKVCLEDYCFISAPFVRAYIHPGNKVSSLVGLSEKTSNVDEIGKFLAMQAASMKPIALDIKDIDSNLIEKEKEIAKEQIKKQVQGKSNEMIENILKGKISKWAKSITLYNQAFIMNDKQTIKDYLKEQSSTLSIENFHWYKVGE